MIKAKKGLLITLFAAMMIFAFGATTAFADVTDSAGNVWSNDFSTVTVPSSPGAPDNYKYNTVREFNGGAIDAVIDPATDVSWTLPSATITYYDLNKAAFAAGSATIKAEYTNGAYTKGSADGLQFSAPDYVTNKATATPVIVPFTTLNAGNWQGVVKGDEEYDATVKTEQNFTLTLDVSYVSAAPTYVYGKVPDKAVKVLAGAAAITDVKFYKDEIPADGSGSVSAGTVNFNYDGKAHKLVNNTVAGYTVSYEVFNKSTGAYDAVGECPAVTNVDEPVIVRATVKDGYPTTDTRHVPDVVNNFTLNVLSTTTQPVFGFDRDGNVGNYSYGVDGAEFDAYAYILTVAAAGATDADKAAIEANKEALQEYFKDYYEVTTEASKAYPDAIALAMNAKTLSADEVKAVEKKYEALMKNFNIAAGSKLLTNGTTATMNINGSGLLAPEIEFTDSPTAVTYKAKKLKKKEASFTVTATSSNGMAVTYKLINAPEKVTIDKTSGTITLAKGLKKGKYNITVKAYIAQGFRDRTGVVTYPSETHAIKIKVKK